MYSCKVLLFCLLFLERAFLFLLPDCYGARAFKGGNVFQRAGGNEDWAGESVDVKAVLSIDGIRHYTMFGCLYKHQVCDCV